jgi:hypothetical protein
MESGNGRNAEGDPNGNPHGPGLPEPSTAASLDERIARQRLVLGHHDALINDDPDVLADSISLAVPLQELNSLSPEDQFRHRASCRIAGDIGLTAAVTTPVAMRVDDHPDCSIVLLNQGCASYWVDGQNYKVSSGESAIFLPGMAYHLQSGDGPGSLCSGLVYNLSPQLLARYLCELSAPGLELEQALRLVERPHSLNLPPLPLGSLDLELTPEALMALAPERAAACERPLLHLQEGIYALSAALLLPDQAERALASWDPLPPTERR